jgi:hypothetical protein
MACTNPSRRPKRSLQFHHGRGDLRLVGDVEFDDLADVAELAGRAPRDRDTAPGPGYGQGRALLERPLGDSESQRVVSQNAGDENTVITE